MIVTEKEQTVPKPEEKDIPADTKETKTYSPGVNST